MSANKAMSLLWAAAADLDLPSPPLGEPSNVTEHQYGDGKYWYSWDNFDSSYSTQYSYDSGSTVEGTLAAGIAQIDTITRKLLFAVRHESGGQFSDWISRD